MKIISLFSQPKSNLSIRAILSAFIATSIGITLGCGSGRQTPVEPALSGSTNVTMLLSATANDQLSQFNIGFNSLTLTTKSGKAVTLFNTAQYAEFIHLNGSAEPLLTLTVPQDIYTAATANIGPASFSCATLIPSTGGLNTSTWAYGYTPSAQVSINLAESITVTGNAMGLSLNLLVSQSASFPSTCYLSGNNQFSITPTFNLAPVAFSTPVKELLLDGQISSVNPSNNSFVLALADGPSLSVNTDNNSTVYQGISGFSLLTAGTFVDMDAVIQADGSQLATRIAVQDTNTTNLSVSTGPVLQTNTVWPVLTGFEREHQGYLTTSEQAPLPQYYSYGNAVFLMSGQFTNLQNLPFSPSFNASNIFAGQNVYITSDAVTYMPGPTYFPASTVTMMPQIINGTLMGSSSDGSFTTYTVTLASYDLIPTLAVQQGQSTVLTDPSTVVVYVDSSTQLLNTKPLAAGNVFRFSGMLFNDNGSLRMDCGQVFDGVPQ